MDGFENKPLAVIGMACRMPGADNLEEFWQLLLEGRCMEAEIPPERFNRELYFDPNKGVLGKSYTSIACLMDYGKVDPTQCPLTPEDIENADISHLTICDVVSQACRHAGYDPWNMPYPKAGVYVGHVKGSELGGEVCFANQIEQVAEYVRDVKHVDQITGGRTDELIEEIVSGVRADRSQHLSRTNLNLGAHHGAGLISKMLKLDGPYMVVNAACASSLQALAMGARALQLGQIDMAIIGGASYCKFDSLVLFSRAQSVSATGTRPFDADADGLVNGEGYAAMLVKTVERAVADQDPILAVIRGIGMSTDGRGKSLWAPRKEGQIEAIQRAYGRDLDVGRLQYIEAHATSTQIGDHTELTSLAETLQGKIPDGTKIPIGSVKGNVGHTIETAGMAGLLKTILSMQHGIVPPAVNLRTLNPKVDWQNSPFFVPTTPTEWPSPADGHPRRAAVNSFGIGGLNVHVVLDDAPSKTMESVSAAPTNRTGRQPPAPPEPIAIIGMGTVLPGARTIENYWQLLQSAEGATSRLPANRWNSDLARSTSKALQDYETIHGGFITDFEYDWKTHRVPPKQIASADPLQFMVLDAVEQAVHMSGYDQRPFDRKRTGVCVGAVSSGEYHESLQMGLRLPEIQKRIADYLRRIGVPAEQIQQVTDEFSRALIERMPAIIDETGSYTTNTLVSRITKTFDLMGGGAAVDSGATSGASALTTSINSLHSGDCDMVICAAGHRALGMLAYQWHAHHGLLSRGAPHSPFDQNADGYVPGEGTCVVVLKRLADAQRDQDKIFGVIRGFGAARAESLNDAIKKAIDRSHESTQIHPGDVAYVETAARGIPAVDRSEVQALADVFTASGRPQPLLLGSAVSQIGHVGGASAIAALVKTIRALDIRKAPAEINLNPSDGILADHLGTIQASPVSTDLSVTTNDGRLQAGVSSVGDQQLSYHFVVERGSKVPADDGEKTQGHQAPDCVEATQPQKSQPDATLTEPLTVSSLRPDTGNYRIVRVGAGSAEKVVERIAQTSTSETLAEALFEQADQVSFGPNDRFRVAIVAENAAELHQKCRFAAPLIGQPESRVVREEKGVFCNQLCERRPQVAFLFPGHGSQYTGMLQTLIQHFPPARQAVNRINTILDCLGYSRFEDVAWHQGDTLGIDVWQTQLALLVADVTVLTALTALGIKPDRVSGHSYGEFPALFASGAWSFEAAARATRARCSAIDASAEARGIMLSVAASPDVVERVKDDLSGELHISVRNAPDQIVVAGEEKAVLNLADRLKGENVVTRVLAAPRPFHTPLMTPTKAPLAKALESIDIEPPVVPVLSSVTNRYVAEPSEIRKNLVAQMTQPVHYDQLIQRLAAEGTNVFVEVGPHQILTKLHRRILADQQVVTIAADQPKRNGLRQLLHVQACLECVGAVRRPSRLDAETIFTLPGRQTEQQQLDTDRSIQTPALSVAVTKAAAETGVSTPATSPKPTPIEAGTSSTNGSLTNPAPTVIHLRGTPYQMGFQHGSAQSAEIRQILHRYADLTGMKWHRIPDVTDPAARSGDYFCEEDLEEMQGIAEGAGVTVQNIIAHNLLLYPDMGSGCAHFALTAATNSQSGMLHGANEDLPLALSVRDCLVRNVQVRHPDSGVPHIAFGVAGQLAAINGVNSQGVAVTSTMLLDLPRRPDSSPGRVHSSIVRSILNSAEDIPSAVEIALATRGTGGWSMCISHSVTDQLSYVEYHGETVKTRSSQTRFVGTNHTQLHSASAKTPAHSLHRFDRLDKLVGASVDELDVQNAQAALRDRYDVARNRLTPHPTMNTIRRIDNQISIVMQPGAQKAWITQPVTPHSTDVEVDSYHLLRLDQLFAEPSVEVDSAIENLQPLRSGQEQLESLISGPAAAIALNQMGIGPDENAQTVCHRFVLRTVESTVPDHPSLPLNGPVLILGQNDVSSALQQQIKQAGGSATVLPVLDCLEQMLTSVDQAWNSQPSPHLILATTQDADATTATDETTWNRRRFHGASLPYFVCQRWCQRLVESGLLERASVLAITSLGGDFGLSRPVRGAEGGALAGLVKSMKIELGLKTKGKFRAKVVDLDADRSPEQIAAAICREFSDRSPEAEVGYVAGRRVVVRPVARPLEAGQLDQGIPAGETWVVTGGARGVTAVVAQELGRRFQLRLHLVGSSPLPRIDESWRNLSDEETKRLRAAVMKEAVAGGEIPVAAWSRVEKAIEIDRNLRDLKEMGVNFTYHACDISDRAALAQVLESARRQDGPIRGVLHGAGFESALRFEKKKADLVERTVSVKVDGAAALMDLTRDDPLRYFVAFGSVSGRFGGLGQTDYGLANDLLSKLVDWYRLKRPECKATTFHWHAWDEVGMAVRPESRHLREIGGITYMPTAEGVAHLIDELSAGAPEREVLITGWPFHKLNPDYADKVAGAAKLSPARKPAVASPRHKPLSVPVSTRDTDPSPILISRMPLIDAAEMTRGRNRMTADIRFDPSSDPFLTQHLFKGRPILPAVISMAAVAQAAGVWGQGEQSVARLRNVEILEPMQFHTDRIETARVRGRMHQQGFACELVGDFRNRAGKLVQADRAYMRAEVELAEQHAALTASLPPMSAEPFTEFDYPEDVVLYHGEVFRALVAVDVEGTHAWGRIRALDTRQLGGSRPGTNWIVPSAAIDAAFYTCGIHVRETMPDVTKIPKSIDQIELGRFPRVGEELLAWVSCREMDDKHAIYDFTIFGDDGTAVVLVKGYHGVFIPRGGQT